MVENLQRQLTSLLGGKTAGNNIYGSAAYVFTQDLSLGAKGDDVYNLQLFLISQPVEPAACGESCQTAQALEKAGATGFFGPLTQAALAEYQKAKGITPAIGYFGVKTRAKVNEGR